MFWISVAKGKEVFLVLELVALVFRVCGCCSRKLTWRAYMTDIGSNYH